MQQTAMSTVTPIPTKSLVSLEFYVRINYKTIVGFYIKYSAVFCRH